MAHKGTDPEEGTSGLCGLDFLDREAEGSAGDTTEEEGDSDASSLADLFDETDQAPGNPLLLLQQQEAEEDERLVTLIKRKHLTTPDAKAVHALSPKLGAMKITTRRVPAKKKLFAEDSGVGESIEVTHEAEDDSGSLQSQHSQVETPCDAENRGRADGEEEDASKSLESTPNDFGRDEGSANTSGSELLSSQVREEDSRDEVLGEGGALATAILQAKNRRVCKLAEFKDLYHVSLTDLARQFKSDKTCGKNWVVVIFGLPLPFYETLSSVLPEHCTFSHMQHKVGTKGGIALCLCEFKATKNRETVLKLLKTLVRQVHNRPYWLLKAQGRNNGMLWGNQCFITVVDNTRSLNFSINIKNASATEDKWTAESFTNYMRHTEEYEVSMILQLCRVTLDPETVSFLNTMDPDILEDWQIGINPPVSSQVNDRYRFLNSLATHCPDKEKSKDKTDPYANLVFWNLDFTESLSPDLDQFPLGRRFLAQTGRRKTGTTTRTPARSGTVVKRTIAATTVAARPKAVSAKKRRR
uniref:Major capsid protein L1 n=1 Tax=Rousettus bat papillomavirus TaxID=3141903 RepID=A0AAU7E345_9PAPI